MITQYFSLRHPLTQQVMRFGVVGCTAALVNFFAVVLLVDQGHLAPLVANIIAFLIAFQVSFYGHRGWTFSANSTKHQRAMRKFFIVAGLSFLLNEGLYALFLKQLHLHYVPALLLVLIIVPPVTFIASRLWAFKS